MSENAFDTYQNENAFDGMDEASRDGRKKLPPHSRTRVRMEAFLQKQTPKYGDQCILEFEVVESSSSDLKPGDKAGLVFSKIAEKDPSNPRKLTKGSEFKQALIKEAIAAMFGIDPKAPQKWSDVTKRIVKDNRMIMGKELVIRMGKRANSPNGEYVEKDGFDKV